MQIARRFVLTLVLFPLLSTTAFGDGEADVPAAVAAAYDLGITPQSTVVAGLESTAAQQILANLEQAAELRQQVIALQVALASASAAVEVASNAAIESAANGANSDALDQALAALATTQSQLDAARLTLLNAGLAGLDGAVVQKLAVARDGQSHNTAAELWAVSRSNGSWAALEVALRAKQRADRTGEAMDEGQAALLAETLADPLVTTAQQALLLQLTNTQQVFATYVPSPE